MTRVSVVIPTQNRPAAVERAVRSVAAQTHEDLEIVVVDDGSATPLALSVRDPRVSVYRLPCPGGVSAARNFGLARATGEWIAFLDDDDLWAPDKLELQLSALGAASADLSYTGAIVISDRGRVLAHRPVHAADHLRDDLACFNAIAGPSTVLMRRSLVESIGPFAEDLSIVADWDLWLRLPRDVALAPVSRETVAFMEHADSMQIAEADQIEAELAILRARHPELLQSARADDHRNAMDLWIAIKRWQSGSKIRNARQLGQAARRHHGTLGALRRGAQWSAPGLRRPPSWVREILDADPGTPDRTVQLADATSESPAASAAAR